jgi:hypothetical protein
MKRWVGLSIGTLILSLRVTITILHQPTKTAKTATSGGFMGTAQSIYVKMTTS